jgi:hypothetical protein
MVRQRPAAIFVAALALAVPAADAQVKTAIVHGAKIPRPPKPPGLAKSVKAAWSAHIKRLTVERILTRFSLSSISLQ